jgi:YHS domain-containing protein
VRGLILLGFVVLLVLAFWPLLRDFRWRWPARATARPDELVKDPACQRYIALSRAMRREIEGHVFYFCSKECAERFVGGERRA